MVARRLRFMLDGCGVPHELGSPERDWSEHRSLAQWPRGSIRCRVRRVALSVLRLVADNDYREAGGRCARASSRPASRYPWASTGGPPAGRANRSSPHTMEIARSSHAATCSFP